MNEFLHWIFEGVVKGITQYFTVKVLDKRKNHSRPTKQSGSKAKRSK